MWYPGQCNAKLVLRVRTAFVKGFSGITRPARPLIIIARSQNSELCDRYGSWRGRFDAGDPSNPFWFPVDCSVAGPSYSVDGHAGIAKGTEETVPDGRTTTVRRFPRRFSTSYTLFAPTTPCPAYTRFREFYNAVRMMFVLAAVYIAAYFEIRSHDRFGIAILLRPMKLRKKILDVDYETTLYALFGVGGNRTISVAGDACRIEKNKGDPVKTNHLARFICTRL